MRGLTVALVAVVLGLSGLSYGLYERQSLLARDNKTLTDAVKRAVERETEYRRILGTRAKENASQRLKLQAAETALQNALRTNKSWSDTDVPPDVQNALSGPSGGLAGP